MSLYIGRDNSGNGIFHSTKDEQSESSLKAGVNEKTLFHSDIPFMRVSKTYNLSLTSREDNPPADRTDFRSTSEYWAFPSAMKTDLRAGYVFLGFATLNDGSKIQIQSDKFSASTQNTRVSPLQGGENWTWYQYGHARTPGAATSTGLSFAFPNNDAVDTYFGAQSTDWAWVTDAYFGSTPTLRSGAGGWLARNTDINTNSIANIPPYLHRDSKGVLMLRCRNGIYGGTVTLHDVVSGKTANAGITPVITSVVYYRLDVKADGNGFYSLPLSEPAPGELYVDNTKLLSNGADHLSNLKYIKFRAWATDGTYVGPTTPGGVVIPANCYSFSHTVGGYPSGMLGSYQEILYNNIQNTPSFRKPYAALHANYYRTHTYGNFTGTIVDTDPKTITPTATMNAAVSALSSYYGALYEIVTLPSVTEIEFTNTSLRVNDSIDIYTETNQPVACVGENRTLTLGTGIRTKYPGSPSATLESSINLGSGLGNHLHLMFGLRGVNTSDQYVYSKWGKTGGVLSIYPPTDAITTDPDLGPQLAALPQNAYVHIGSLVFEGRDNYSPPDDACAVGISLCLRYTGTTIQLWSIAHHVSSTTDYMQYQMPRASINIMRLTSG